MASQSNFHNHNSGVFAEMSDWYETPIGMAFLEAESEFLNPLLPRSFGYHLLQLGCANLSLFEASPIGHKFTLTMDKSAQGHDVIASAENLPIAADSVDLVILHHALDFSENQHQLLREVSRVLIEGGDLVIIGFNPYSSWGLRRAFQWTKKTPWQAKTLSTGRLCDWLKLLEFQVEKVEYAQYSLPINIAKIIRYSALINTPANLLNWPTGSSYFIHAKKDVLPVTPIKKSWRKLSNIKPIALPVAEKISQSSTIYKQDSAKK